MIPAQLINFLLAAVCNGNSVRTYRLLVKTTTKMKVRAIQDHKVIEENTCWKCRLWECTDNI